MAPAAPSTEEHNHSHSRSDVNCDFHIPLKIRVLYVIRYTIRTTAFLKMTQEV